MASDVTITYQPSAKQRLFHLSVANEVLYGGAAGGGKDLAIDTPIPTSRGWVRMGDIAVGDMVFGPDGQLYPVTKAHPIHPADGYRITFDDGSKIVANLEHLWFTYTASDLAAMTRRTDEYRAKRRATRPSSARGNKSPAFTSAITARNKSRTGSVKPHVFGSVKTTAEIVGTLRTKQGRTNHAIPVTAPLQLPEKQLPVDPYLLGLWLGDGDSKGGGFTSADGLEQAFIDAGFHVAKVSGAYRHSIHGLATILRKMGLLNNKHLPDGYLWTSEAQRLALLQGLMDTDGNCNKNGTAEFTGTNQAIVEDVALLIRSLGMKATVREGRARLNGKDCGQKWSIKYTPSVPVFRLSRKAERQVAPVRRVTTMRYIVSAERLPQPVPMRCIAIDSPDHLYLAGEHFIPTHNSVAIVLDALKRCLKYAGTRAYMFRRTYPELEDTLITEALRWYPKEIASYNVGRHEMTLINGSKVFFRHCANVKAMYDYAGAEIHWLYIDELTSFEREIYDFLKTRLRARADLGITPVVRCASNPGNIGHGWVKKYFVDAGEYGSLITHAIKSKTTGKVRKFTTQYIPALAMDNPYITEDYIYELERKPDALRRALLLGDWDAFEGQVFTEWRDDPDHYEDRRWTHVIKPFPVPVNWPRYMSFDHGYTRPFSVQWWAIGPNGEAYLYREWYGCDPDYPNVGIKLSPRQIAQGIVDREREFEGADNLSVDRIADPSIFERSRGDSVAQQMEPNDTREGIYFRKGDNARIAGKMQYHERLRFGEDGKPLLQVFETCKDFIRTIPNLPYDPKKPEDVDTASEDHAYDAGRYFMMARPAPLREIELPKVLTFDPYSNNRRRA